MRATSGPEIRAFGDELEAELTRTGYAAGVLIPADSPWLTVVGSAYRSDLVYPTRALAEARAAELREKGQQDIVVRRVRPEYCAGVSVTQTAYRSVG